MQGSQQVCMMLIACVHHPAPPCSLCHYPPVPALLTFPCFSPLPVVFGRAACFSLSCLSPSLSCAGKRFAVGMCSLQGHQLAGEERFAVDMLPDGSVWWVPTTQEHCCS